MRWSYKNGGIAQFVGKLTLPALCSALLPKRTSTPEAEFESDQKWLLIITVDPCKYSRAPAPFYCSACWCCGPAWPPLRWTRRWLTIIPSRQRTCPAQHGGSPLVLVIIKIAAGSAGNSLGLSVEVVAATDHPIYCRFFDFDLFGRQSPYPDQSWYRPYDDYYRTR